MNVETIYQPINGTDYKLGAPNPLSVDMWGAVGVHTHFTVRVIKIGQTGTAFHETSTFDAGLNRETLSGLIPGGVGGYISYIESSMSDRQPPAAAFVVTP